MNDGGLPILTLGPRRLHWRNFDDVSAYAREHGGETAVRALLADGTQLTAYDPTTSRVGREWLVHVAAERADELTGRSVSAAEREAKAAERAVLTSAIAIGVSVVALAVSVLAYLKPPAQQSQPDLTVPAPGAEPVRTSPVPETGTRP